MSGTSCIPKTSLTAQEICDIIKACGESKVRVLKFSGLYLSFGTSPEVATVVQEPSSTPAAEIADTQDQEAKRSFEIDEAAAKQARLDLMKIEDPTGYEELMLSGELEDDDEQSDDAEA